jgi:hypothetical protein
MNNYKDQLFLSVYEAARIVSGMTSDDWESELNSVVAKYAKILKCELPIYVYIDGLYKCNLDNQAIRTCHLEGYCRQITFDQGIVYEADKYLNCELPLDLNNCRILDVESSILEQITLSDLHGFLLSTGFKPKRLNFEQFFNEALGTGGLDSAEELSTDGQDNMDYSSFLEIAKDFSHFLDLINVFGKNYEVIAIEVLESKLDRHINLKNALKKNPMENEAKVIPSTNLTGGQDIAYPEDLERAINVYKNVWAMLPDDMQKPSKPQVENYIRELGFTGSKKLLNAVILVSKPTDVTFGGKQNPDLKPWSQKN